MIRTEQEVFIQLSGEGNHRILHPAKATVISRTEVQLEPCDPNLPLDLDQNIRVFHQADDFMQQTATVVAVSEENGDGAITVELTSKPASAESRAFYRVSTVLADLTAGVGSEESCKLVDISMMGFAVIATKRYEVGEILDTELRFEGSVYAGQTCVQSVRDLGAGRTRYGLLPLADDADGTHIFAGMQLMTTALQRLQLRRVSGAV